MKVCTSLQSLSLSLKLDKGSESYVLTGHFILFGSSGFL